MQLRVQDDPEIARTLRARRSAAQAALAMGLGILLSGPVALAVVALVHPQPAWRDARTFAASFHWIQLAPYAGGLVLVGGCVALIAALHPLVPAERRTRATFALALTGAFAALIFFNYIVQTTFVPALARPYDAANDALVAALTMVNPRSLAWALEMWGYAIFGVATWAIAPAFAGTGRLARTTRALCVANAVVSLAGGVATTAAPGWEMTVPGLAGFAAWNALMVAIAACAATALSRRSDRRTS